jgi:hypothetical protein
MDDAEWKRHVVEGGLHAVAMWIVDNKTKNKSRRRSGRRGKCLVEKERVSCVASRNEIVEVLNCTASFMSGCPLE